MAYYVLARRFRPQAFDAVVGQAHITRTLTNELKSGRIGHAFLFSGSRGVGKTTTARILAKALNCEKGPTPEPCGVCESCQAIAAGSAVDVIEIDGASNRGIDEIRDLRENVRYAPVSSRFKIFIIDEVHMLTKEAFNALLKTLEEPPERVKFILATTESHKVPATIRSRCQHFDFRLVPTDVLVKTLEGVVRSENLQFPARSLRLIAQAGRGSVRDALSMMEQVLAFSGSDAAEEDVASILGIARLEVFHTFMDGILGGDVDLLLRTTDRLLENGYDLYQITQAFLDYLRDLAVLASVPMPGGLLDRAAEDLPRLEAYAKKAGLETLMRYFALVQTATERMRGATHPRPIFEMMLVSLSRVRGLQPLDHLAHRLAELEQRLRDDGRPELAQSGPFGPGSGPGRTRDEGPSKRQPDPSHSSDRSRDPTPTDSKGSGAPRNEAPPTAGVTRQELREEPPAVRDSLTSAPMQPPGPVGDTRRESKDDRPVETESTSQTPPPASAETTLPFSLAPAGPGDGPAAELSRARDEMARALDEMGPRSETTVSEPQPTAPSDRTTLEASSPAAQATLETPAPRTRAKRGRPARVEASEAPPVEVGTPAAPVSEKEAADVLARANADPLEFLERICTRLEARGASGQVIYSIRGAGAVTIGPETVLAVGPGQTTERQKLEQPSTRSVIESALAEELKLPRVVLRVELRDGELDTLFAKDTAERLRQERLWIGMARSVDAVRSALEVFGGRIESVQVQEEDGETSTIAVEDEAALEAPVDAGR